MRKVIILLLCILFIMSAIGCSPKTDSDTEKGVVSDTLQNDKTEDTTVKKEREEPVEKEWGVTENTVVDKDNVIHRVFVNFTDYIGPSRGTGKLATQNDGAIMILDSQVASTTVEVPSGKVEDVFPAYFEQTELIMESQFIGRRLNFEFVVETKENVTINGYEMCKFTGTHTYEMYTEDGIFSQKFVAYATKTKANDAFVYWMVLDGTEDGSLENELAELGEKMAYSFREE